MGSRNLKLRESGGRGAPWHGRGNLGRKGSRRVSREGRRRIRRRGHRPVGLVLNPKQTRGLCDWPLLIRGVHRTDWDARECTSPKLAPRRTAFVNPRDAMRPSPAGVLRARKTSRFLYLRATEMATPGSSDTRVRLKNRPVRDLTSSGSGSAREYGLAIFARDTAPRRYFSLRKFYNRLFMRERFFFTVAFGRNI